MKKAISLLLALVLCLSLCACGGGNDTPETKGNEGINTPTESQVGKSEETEETEPSVDILGEWHLVSSTDYALIFNDDGTGVRKFNGGETSFTWKYDEELKCYTVALENIVSVKPEVVDGIEQFTFGASYCVRPEHHAEAHEAYLAEQEAQQGNDLKDAIRAEIEGKTLAQFNTPYKMSDNVEITIAGWEVGTHNIRGTDCAGIWLTVEVKNLTDSDMKWTELPIVEGDMWVIHGNSISQGSCVFYEYFNSDDSGTLVSTFPANETVKCLVNVAGNSYDDFDASVETFGYVMGFISFTFDGIEYYLDLADIQIVK